MNTVTVSIEIMYAVFGGILPLIVVVTPGGADEGFAEM